MRNYYLAFLLVFLWSCKKEIKSSDKEILNLSIEKADNPFLAESIQSRISGDTIHLLLPSDTLGYSIAPTLVVSNGAAVKPSSKEKVNVDKPVKYEVTAADGSTKKYILISQSKASQKELLNMAFHKEHNEDLPFNILAKIQGDTLKIRLPDSSFTRLKPVFKVSEGATIESVDFVDYSSPQRHTVTATDGSKKTYVTAVSYAAKPQLKSLKINGVDCAYDAPSRTFYFPVSLNKSVNRYIVSFNTENISYMKLDNVPVHDRGTVDYALSTNKEIAVNAYNEFDQQDSYKLIITGLPIVQLQTDDIIGDNAINAHMSLSDPDHQNRKTNFAFNSNITIKYRGATSRTYPKKQFAVKTVDENFKKAEKSILGLRTDNSWILDAMYIDKGRMRNRVCTDIWNSMNNVPHIAKEPDALNGTRGHMVEVFINNRYEGLYCLTEKLDRKQLKIKKEYGVSYKGDNWGTAVQFNQASPYNNLQDTWNGWEFAYPEIGDDPVPDWKYAYEFVEFVSTATDEQFKQKIAEKIYLDNVIDYLIFINAVGAADNTAKNTFLSFYDYRNDHKFFYSVWDLDGTLGRAWNGVKFQENTFEFLGLNNNLFRRLLKTNPDNFIPRLKQRWNQLKANQLSPTEVNKKIDYYHHQLAATKGLSRDLARWNNIPSDSESERYLMTSWYGFHQNKLNTYINNL